MILEYFYCCETQSITYGWFRNVADLEYEGVKITQKCISALLKELQGHANRANCIIVLQTFDSRAHFI